MDQEPSAVISTAADLVAALHAQRRPGERAVIQKRLRAGDETIGIRMRDLFATARSAVGMPLDELEVLFASAVYEVRMSAFCILDFRAKGPRVSDAERERLCTLYLDHHDRITTWDMVDRAAPSVVGGFLLGRSSEPLHVLAAAADPLRRRTAITAPLWFIRHGADADVAAVFPVAETLLTDPDPVVSKAVGIALKHAAVRSPGAVRSLLEAHAGQVPRHVLTAATSRLDPGVGRGAGA